jgi:hypothetical protein
MTKSNQSVGARLEALRGRAPGRSPTVRNLAQYAANARCGLATLGFAARVDFDRLLVGTPYSVPFGQSPFALARGTQFEQRLRRDDYAPLRALFEETMGLELARILNLREKSWNQKGMAARAERTAVAMREIVRRTASAPQLLDGAVLTRKVAGEDAYFEADAVAIHVDGSLRAGEVKSFPTVDGRADPEKVGAAMAQVAIYVSLLQDLVAATGGDPTTVSTKAILITPKNTGLQPTLTVKEIAGDVRRARRILDTAPDARDLLSALPADLPSFAAVAGVDGEGKATPDVDPSRRVEAALVLAEKVGTRFGPECLSSCGMSRLCRERAQACGDPARLGPAITRVLPKVASLDRVLSLADGEPANDDERPVAEQLIRVARLRRAFVPSAAPAARSAEGGRR